MDRERDGPGSSVTHRVGRLCFEIDGGEETVLLKLRGEIAGGAETWIPEALDEAFAALGRPDHAICMERLEVDLGWISADRLTPSRLTAAVRARLMECLEAPSSGSDARSVPGEGYTLAEAFRFFLETGRLPWWSPAATLPALEAEIALMTGRELQRLADTVAPALRLHSPARRLVLQVKAKVAAAIAAALPGAQASGIGKAEWRDMFLRTMTEPRSLEAETVAARIRAAAGPGAGARGSEAEALPEAEAEAIPRPISESERPQPADAEADPPLDAAIPIANAGLVLAHPFLPLLFETRGLVADGTFNGEADRERGVHLVACLAADAVEWAEPDLVLPKLLCGWPLDEPVARGSLLEPGDREEAGDLLRSLIEHWAALRNASVEALRETFLMRPGRLLDQPSGWRLEVERRGTDVLLERLPWTLSTVRLRWMERPVFVEWL